MTRIPSVPRTRRGLAAAGLAALALISAGVGTAYAASNPTTSPAPGRTTPTAASPTTDTPDVPGAVGDNVQQGDQTTPDTTPDLATTGDKADVADPAGPNDKADTTTANPAGPNDKADTTTPT